MRHRGKLSKIRGKFIELTEFGYGRNKESPGHFPGRGKIIRSKGDQGLKRKIEGLSGLDEDETGRWGPGETSSFFRLFFILSGEKTDPSPKRGSVLRPQPLKSLYAFRGSIGRVVFRGFWGNLPGLLGKLFHFSGASGETFASGAASRACFGRNGSGPCSASITAPMLAGRGGFVKNTFG